MSAPPLPKSRVDESNTISVLLVTPNSRLRLQLREKLRQPRWNLTEAAGGAEALECLHEMISEILLLDPLLPDLESSEFSAMVREQFPSVQILTVNSHTGQLVLGTSSPTALSAQLTEVLYCAGVASSNTNSPVHLRCSPPVVDGETGPRGLLGMVGDTAPMQRVYEL